MTLTHELGHLVIGWGCGGTLRAADLRPWRLPYSIFDPNPRPLLTLWGGPVLGVLFPLASALLMRRPSAWFVAYFCLLANGVYLSAAWLSGDRFLDTSQLLEHGAHPAVVVLYCVLTIGFGYAGFRRHCLRVLSSPADANPAGSTGETDAERGRGCHWLV